MTGDHPAFNTRRRYNKHGIPEVPLTVQGLAKQLLEYMPRRTVEPAGPRTNITHAPDKTHRVFVLFGWIRSTILGLVISKITNGSVDFPGVAIPYESWEIQSNLFQLEMIGALPFMHAPMEQDHGIVL